MGVLLVPQSLARLHHRKDLTYRPVPEAPESRVALSWPEAETTPDLVEEFIGIVRGRTVNSTRGRAATPPRPAKDKAKAKDKARDKSKRAGAGGAGGARNKPAGGRKPPSGGRDGGRSGKRGKPRGR